MFSARSCELPSAALLRRYADSGAFTDCYVTEIGRMVSHAEYVEAFYTTAVFKAERLILRLAVSRRSSDAQARALAQGRLVSFAAWSVEERAPEQLLLADFAGRTKSWLMVTAAGNAGAPCTLLYFGSAVVPARKAATGRKGLGFVFTALLGFHRLYSRVLLQAARSRLERHDARQ